MCFLGGAVHGLARTMSATGARLCALTCLLACGAALSLASGSSRTVSFTFLLPAGQSECFYQTAARSDSIEVDYQVHENTLPPSLLQ